ncbi:GSCOCT00014047001.2-RA-CDS [Cotesia congregata]|uniref:TransformerB n=1 Tax=Cotesia congregata TaxID=51543 RepID=A0A8J2EFA5_COTCN|nr:GSCOCT00014047001.2-RA-CDS [Cotesia congregata]CAG5073429.1 transformerB [Cotesia congregata]
MDEMKMGSREGRAKFLLNMKIRCEHERVNQMMIQKYEEARARKLSCSRSRNRYRSLSSFRSNNRNRRRSLENSCRQEIRCSLPHILDKSKKVSLLKGLKGARKSISPTKLKGIIVTIDRDISTTSPQLGSIKRDIVNLETDVVVMRRKGEGITPIFDRPELKTSDILISNDKNDDRRTIRHSYRSNERSSRDRKRDGSSSRGHRSRDRSNERSSLDRKRDGSSSRDHRSRYRSNERSSRDRKRDGSPRGHRSRDRSNKGSDRYGLSERISAHWAPPQFPIIMPYNRIPMAINPMMTTQHQNFFVSRMMPPMISPRGPMHPNFLQIPNYQDIKDL